MRKDAILRKRLPELGVDGALISDINNLRYITGFTGSSGFLIITKKDSVFVTDFRYQEQARQEVKGFKIRVETTERTKTIKEIVDEYGIKKLGFEDHSINYRTYKKLLRHKLRLKALTDTVEELRLIKSGQELSYIKTAIQRAESAFKKLLPFIRAGITERKLAMMLEGLLREEGCKRMPFGVIVASGSMSAIPHAQPTGRRLKKGDFILFDWGGECEGYYSDMSRMVAIKGKGMELLNSIYSIVLAAQEKAISSIKPGVKAKAIDKSARDFIRQRGYGNYFGHGTGHGIGLTVHERPVISWRSTDMLERGMVFTIEPGIYLQGTGGVRIEDIVAVGENGAELLTTLPRRLHII